MSYAISIKALFGPAADLTTVGGFTAWRATVFASILVGLMAIFTVVRHTRAEEDAGRAELVASAVVGLRTRLASAFTLAAGTSVVIGVVITVALSAVGAATASAAAIGAAIASSGVAFAGVAAVTAQLGSFSRTANGLAVNFLGATFLVRGWGDSSVGATWLSWLSPLGWAREVQPFTETAGGCCSSPWSLRRSCSYWRTCSRATETSVPASSPRARGRQKRAFAYAVRLASLGACTADLCLAEP
jgi:ABC-2 type transport system permease protein